MSNLGYVVSYTTTVDYPELRGPSYSVVPAGFKIPQRIWCPKRSIALSLVKGILEGEEDFESEYVTSAQAWSETVDPCKKRTVRKYHSRGGRDEPWRVS